MRRTCWILSLIAIAALLAACGKGEPVTAPDAAAASSGGAAPSTTTVGPSTTNPPVGPFLPSTTAPGTTTAPTTTAPTTTAEATTTTAAPATTAPTTTAPPSTTAPTTVTSPPAPPTSAPTTTPPTSAPPAPAATAPGTWTVAAGDSFWSIAEAVVAQRLGRAPAVAEIDPVWRALIEANRTVLPKPGNPDLILVGMVLTIPT